MSEVPQALSGKKELDPKEWERKQRLKEYRIASRREKRNRKSDEKKQRRLNATILRRMTRNSDKYNKNAGRNRLRAIEMERRMIWANAVKMAQRLAAVHDPSGVKFNVGPVTILEDGAVVSLEALERRKERQRERELKEQAAANGEAPSTSNGVPTVQPTSNGLVNGMNPQRHQLVQKEAQQSGPRQISKTQQRKLEALAPRPPPPKPTIPEGIEIPSDEEEDWISLWDLPDGELERRVVRAKKRAAAARKALRVKQKEGKAERRAARDEKRKVYRELKEAWKVVREDERRQKKAYLSIENEERKRLADEVNAFERKEAMEYCAQLGFTLENVEGVAEIQPKALGMKGVEVDFGKIEVGDAPSALKVKSNRVNLGVISDESKALHLKTEEQRDEEEMMQDFIKFEEGEGQDFEAATYNHRLRRKLRRAIIAADIKKELLVREKAIQYLTDNNMEVPDVLKTSGKVVNERQPRTLPNGLLETAKQERVRLRVELTEFNVNARVLRAQAKQRATYAGLRVYAELTGQIPRQEDPMDIDTQGANGAEAPESESDSEESDSDASPDSDGE